MTGLDRITSKIIADANTDAEKAIAAAEETCRQIMADYDKRAEEMRAELTDQAEREAADIISRAKSVANMDKRNITMAAQSRMVDEAFALAKEKILNLSRKDYLKLLSKLLCGALYQQSESDRENMELYGDDLPEIEKYELILNQSDRAVYGKDVIVGAKNLLAGKVSKDISDKLCLSDRTEEIDGGLILKYGDIELNCSIDMMLAGVREESESEVCGVLFG